MKNFLENLYRQIREDQFIELRCFSVSGGNSIQKFYRKNELTQLMKNIEVLDGLKDYTICTGVLPRNGKSGLSTGRNITTMQALWIDIDDKTDSLDNILKRLQNASLRPTYIVYTGHGYHGYWLLDELFNGSPEEINLLSKKLHKMLGGDHTHDLSRVFRTPGTLNVKNKNDIKQSVVVEYSPDAIYSIARIQRWLADVCLEDAVITPSLLEAEKKYIPTFTTWAEIEEMLPLYVARRIVSVPMYLCDPVTGEPDRSKNDFYVATSLYELGFTTDQVGEVFRIAADHGFAIGEKYKTQGSKYLVDYTLRAARASVDEQLPELLNKLEALEDESQFLPLLRRGYKLAGNTRAEDYIMRLNKCAKKFGLTKEQILVEMNRNLAGAEGYKFEKFKSVSATTIVHKSVAEKILQHSTCIALGNSLYRYTEGVFRPANGVDAESIEASIWALVENRPAGGLMGYDVTQLVERTIIDLKVKDINEIMTYILQTAPRIDLSTAAPHEGFICLQNGMLNLETRELLPHDPKYLALAKLNASYKPDARCELLNSFIEETFNKEDIHPILEFLGLTVVSNTPIKKFMILLGSGNNGKSVWLNILRNFLGKPNVSNERLESLATRQFAKASLLGKLANIASDIGSKAIEDISAIKEFTGNDQLSADRKFLDPVTFVNRAALMFSCNALPLSQSADEAFFRRAMIIDCPNVVTEANQDLFLERKLSTDDARSALLNIALEGYDRYVEQKYRFSESSQMERQLSIYKRSCRPDMHFVDRFVVKGGTATISLESVMRHLVRYLEISRIKFNVREDELRKIILSKYPGIKESTTGGMSFTGIYIDTTSAEAHGEIASFNIRQ